MAYKVALDELELRDFEQVALERELTASAAANDLIREALERDLVPNLKAISTTNSMPTFQLRSSLLGRTKRHLKQNHYSFDKGTSQTLTGLIRAAMYEREGESGIDEFSDYTMQFFSRAGIAPRDMQMELVSRFIKQQSSGQVSLHEASTGIGKTAAKLCAASYLIEKGEVSTVLIAVPTNKLINQTIRQGKRYGLEIQKLSAKADFISDTALSIAIDDHPEHGDTLNFISDEVVKAGSYEIARLPGEVKDAIAKLPCSITCDQNTPEGDAGGEEYEQSCADFQAKGIVISTHAMLAHELFRLIYGRSNTVAQYGERYGTKLNYELHGYMQRKKANVGATAPKFDEWVCDELEASANEARFDVSGVYLPFALSHSEKMAIFIDEAHLYSSQVELALTSSVSIDLLIKRLSSASTIANRCRAFSGVAESLALLRDVDVHSSGDIKDVLNDALDGLKQVSSTSVAGLDAKSQLRLNRIKSSVSSLMAFSSSPFDCHLSRSHRREKLSLHSLAGLMQQLVLLQATHRFCYSIAYLSATLNDHSGDYRFSRSGLRLNAHGSKKQLVKNESLIAPWLYQGVQFKICDEFESNEDYQQKADRIYAEWQSIEGGTLVLCNSYFEIESLAARLVQLDPGIKIIADQSGVKLNNASEFLNSYRRGEKPIFLGTGATWTGLDMTDSEVPAVEDNLIQLLVVTKAPYSYVPVDRSDFHAYVFAKRSAEALVKLKQGFGRLVRRDGRKGMRILYLDAKYRSPHRVIFKRYIERMYKPNAVD